MKVLHVPYCFSPDPVGGTEIYVEALAYCQRQLGVEPVIAAPAPERASYSHAGFRVHRYQTAKHLGLRGLYGEGDATAAESFVGILHGERPDLVHLHAFTSGVSIRVVRAAHDAGIPVVFTYHTATVSCPRGNLLRWGREPCDGFLDLNRCARCRLHGNGLPIAASWLVGSLPTGAGRCLGGLGLSGNVWTALRATELIRVRHDAARALFREADAVIAVCEWTRRLLARNGFDRSYLIRNGVDLRKLHPDKPGPVQGTQGSAPRKPRPDGTPLRIAFLGRLSAGKGLDVLLDAAQRSPDLRFDLDIFTVSQGSQGEALKQKLSAKYRHDGRIHFLPAMPSEETVGRLREYDVLALPSQAMEPGPLVIYEALAAGTPIIGSDLGGIPELIHHGENGLLVEPSSAVAWASALRRLIEEPELLPKLSRGIGPARTMVNVAREIQPVYESVLVNKQSRLCL